MRAKEFITELKVGTLHIGELIVDVDDHIFDRKIGRRVNLQFIDRAVRRLTIISDQIINIEAGQQFWVYNTALDIGLGFRKLGRPNQILLKTVVGDRPWSSDIPVIEI